MRWRAVGSTGLGLVNKPTAKTDKYTEFNNQSGANKWFHNDKLSNYNEWDKSLTQDELQAISWYTGSSYDGLNSNLYTTPWKDMSDYQKEKAIALYNALNKFELKKGITTTRKTDEQALGFNYGEHPTIDQIKQQLSKTNGVVQLNGFLSSGADDHGVSVQGSSVQITFKIPPSKGAGAYVANHSNIKGENEFLLNNNAVVKYDLNSIKKVGGKVYITAYWLGNAKDQKFKK